MSAEELCFDIKAGPWTVSFQLFKKGFYCLVRDQLFKVLIGVSIYINKFGKLCTLQPRGNCLIAASVWVT